mmetsp:Transcript_18540/g.31000  ORF Transcript_18540/g.31000 Transcript_18540/m.31000 type:complete len:104 (-) Transcript_18540:87-398(-)
MQNQGQWGFLGDSRYISCSGGGATTRWRLRLLSNSPPRFLSCDLAPMPSHSSVTVSNGISSGRPTGMDAQPAFLDEDGRRGVSRERRAIFAVFLQPEYNVLLV